MCGVPLVEDPEAVRPRLAPRQRTRRGSLASFATSHKRLSLLTGICVFAAIAVGLASLVRGNDGSPASGAAARKSNRPPGKAKPLTYRTATRYNQLLRAGQTATSAAKPLCSRYSGVIGKWSAKGQSLSDRLPTLVDPYDAYAFLSERPWVRQVQVRRSFKKALEVISRSGLRSATRGAAQRRSFVHDFQRDALFACDLSSKTRRTDTDLWQIQQRARLIVESAALKPWYPKGYESYSEHIAWRWDPDPGSSPDCVYGATCWGAYVMTKSGCPNGLYVEGNILSGGVVIDYTNDLLPSLEAFDIARMTFTTYDPPGDATLRLTDVNCY